MKKRILSWLLAFCMVFSMLPATAFATGEDQTVETESETLPTEPTEVDTTATVSTLRVGGVDALAQNAGDGWYFDPATDTLHLTGAYYDGDAEDAIYAEGDLTIDVAEGTENTFRGVNNGILALGNLTITGSGMLTATASAAYGNGGDYGPVGVYVSENLRITGANVAADADMVGIGSIGTMEIVDSTVEALGARNGLYSFDDLRISGSNVEAHATSVQADNKWDFRGYFLMGICAQEGDLLIENGASVNVSADQFGLYAENTTIQDSDLCATATKAAICTAQKLTINGESNVQLHATLTEEQHEEYGDQATALFGAEIEIDENLTIVGGVIGDSLVQGGAKSIVDSEGKDVVKASIISSVASGTCGDNLTWTLDADGVLTISGEGAMYDYSFGTAPWNDYRDQILSAVVKDGVMSIGSYAFNKCSSLVSIDLPDSVTSIGESAFSQCSSLASIDLPDSLTFIDEYAFSDCCSLTSIDLPDSLTLIGYCVFEGCSNLASIAFPDCLNSISSYAFKNCSSLTSIDLPAGLTSISDRAFYNCSSLTEITFSGSAPQIGINAFYGVTTTAYYPAGDASWTEEAKQNYGGTITWEAYDNGDSEVIASGNCGVNMTWTLDAEGILTISGEGTMYDYGRVDAPWYEYREQILSAVVEDGVTSIGDYAFRDCSKLTSIAIPASVTSIGHAAFHSCSSLTSIAIPAGVTSIRDYAFYGCSSLPSIALPAGVTSIGEYALAKCSSLISIPIPAGVTSIGEYAFYGCSSLKSIAIPAGVTSIAAGMFSTCSSLTSVDLPAGVTSIGGSAFYNCNSLTSINLPAGVTTIGDYAFSNSNKLKSIEIPAGVTSISHSTFHGCSGLASVDLPAGVTSIGVSAFSYCINLTSIDLPAGVTTIGDYAFRSCRGLESIDIPRGVTSIGDSAFAYCEDLVTVTFKGDAPSIHTFAFEDVTANAYYPDGNATWTEEVKQNYSGSLTWIAATFASFEDVVPGAYYEIPVQWAVENGITSGVDENHFAPNAACTRAQVVTFLWRAAGSPEPASMNNPFVDVAADSFYYKAVLWAVENGITSGNDATHFAPNDSCNRAQVVTFLWRFRGRPASGGNNIFTDVEAGSYYYDAVLWAVEKGITSGMGDGTFGTNTACNRGQIVTFLYKAVG